MLNNLLSSGIFGGGGSAPDTTVSENRNNFSGPQITIGKPPGFDWGFVVLGGALIVVALISRK
jgi:hypothetical protein